MKTFLYLFCILLCIPAVFAVNFAGDEITLLSVVAYDNETRAGDTAEFSLDIQTGTGKVFLESYPAAEIDMQVATRLANEYACELSGIDCTQYDFFYTIHSGSPLIGGPSGGGAATVLTLAVLLDQPVDERVAMTGAISAGGLITAVSGIPEKIQAGQDQGYEHIVIPFLAFGNESNSSELQLEDLENYTVSIHPVQTVQEAYFVATGEQLVFETEISIPDWYRETMRQTADMLCARTMRLLDEVPASNSSLYLSAQGFVNESRTFNETYYARASYCFSANIPLQQLRLENYSQDVLRTNVYRLEETIDTFREKIENFPIVSFTDLEAYVIVKERLLEAETLLDEVNQSNISTRQLGYAIERYESAVAWSNFFGKSTDRIELDSLSLQRACFTELQSVETRMSYLSSIFPESFLESVRQHQNQAYVYADDDEFALCLFKASKAKAHANLFYTTIGSTEQNFDVVADVKYQAAQATIAKQQPIFPLLGYSYLEYSKTFQEDLYSGLVFAEYAVVHSDVSGYFPYIPPRDMPFFTQPRDVFYYLAGMLTGVGLLLFLQQFRKKP